MKDRLPLAMVEAAEADGRLWPGGSVVEYTDGTAAFRPFRNGRGQMRP
jgi:cysteine synthase